MVQEVCDREWRRAVKSYYVSELPVNMRAALINWGAGRGINVLFPAPIGYWVDIMRAQKLMTNEIELELAALLLSGKE